MGPAVSRSLSPCPRRRAFLRHSYALVVLAAGCRREAPVAAVRTLVLATGGAGGAFHQVGTELARLTDNGQHGFRLALTPGSSGANLDALQLGRAHVAFAQADVAYAAYRRGTEAEPTPHTQLRGIAVLWLNTFQLVVRRDSPIRTVGDLRGRRISVGAAGGGSATLARLVLEASDIGPDDVTITNTGFDDSIAAFRDGRIDAMLFSAGIPTQPLVPVATDPGFRLVPVPQAAVSQMRAQYPFLEPQVIAARTYDGLDLPTETLGIPILLTCRADLDEELVRALTVVLFRELPALQQRVTAAAAIDVDLAPTAPLPLHPGAARFYREREIEQ